MDLPFNRADLVHMELWDSFGGGFFFVFYLSDAVYGVDRIALRGPSGILGVSGLVKNVEKWKVHGG